MQFLTVYVYICSLFTYVGLDLGLDAHNKRFSGSKYPESRAGANPDTNKGSISELEVVQATFGPFLVPF